MEYVLNKKMNNNIFQKTISGILITIIFIINWFSVFNINIVKAQPVSARTYISPISASSVNLSPILPVPQTNKLSALLPSGQKVPTDDVKSNFKKFTLDAIVVDMSKTTLNALTESIVNWINRGFNGNPAFVDDFGGFLREVADRETAYFIEGSPLELLCSPWKLQIQIALSIPTGYRKEIACTLSDIVANMDEFINGDFSQGGWGGWLALTTRPNNNPYGIYLSASSELDSRIAAQQGIDTTKLNWAKGFLSKEVCEETPLKDGETGPGRPQNCKIVTPGSVIEDQLANILGSSVRQLELADDFNEIVNALIGYLTRQVLVDRGGLRNTPSYLGVAVTSGNNPSLVSSNKFGVTAEINTVVALESQYNNSKRQTFNTIIPAEIKLNQLYQCYKDKLNDKTLALKPEEKAIANTRMENATSTINSQILPEKIRISEEINISNDILLKLQDMIDEANNASASSELLGILSRYQSYAGSGVVHSSLDYSDIDVQSAMNDISSTTDGQIAECQNFPPPPAPETTG
jgi:hypothetical protein